MMILGAVLFQSRAGPVCFIAYLFCMFYIHQKTYFVNMFYKYFFAAVFPAANRAFRCRRCPRRSGLARLRV